MDVQSVGCFISLATAAATTWLVCAHLVTFEAFPSAFLLPSNYLLKVPGFNGNTPTILLPDLVNASFENVALDLMRAAVLTVSEACVWVFRRDLPTVLSSATRGQESFSDLRSAMAQVTSEALKEGPTQGPLCAFRGQTLRQGLRRR